MLVNEKKKQLQLDPKYSKFQFEVVQISNESV